MWIKTIDKEMRRGPIRDVEGALVMPAVVKSGSSENAKRSVSLSTGDKKVC